MNQMINSKNYSFRRQLMIFLIAAIALLSLVSSTVSSWIALHQSGQVLEKNALQIADHFSKQSVLALLTRSEDNAESALSQVMGFADVTGGAIFADTQQALFMKGEIQPDQTKLADWLSSPKPIIAVDTRDYWIITSPVILEDNRQTFTEFALSQTHTQQLLGFVMIQVSKSSIVQLTQQLFSYTIGIGIVFALLCLWLLNIGLRRIIDPIRALSATMKAAQDSGVHTYAEISGPQEVHSIAQSYNAMMAALEAQEKRLKELNTSLESEVEIRTKELTHARDTALVAVRTQSEFLANISHELRTPLQAVTGYIDLVVEELNEQGMYDQVSDLEASLSAANRLLTLINSILDLAKCEAGKTELVLTETPLNRLIKETEAIIRPLAVRNSNTLTIHLPDNDSILLIDKEKTQQILLNLLSNACKFTKAGTVELHIDLQDEKVKFSVSDTGVGIAADKLESIFDKFSQGDGSVKRRYGGTGLGLAISKHFAEMMNGSIHVSSVQEQGSLFSLTLPKQVTFKNSLTMGSSEGQKG